MRHRHPRLLAPTLGERASAYAFTYAHAEAHGPRFSLALVLATLEETVFGQYWAMVAIDAATG